MPVPALPVRFQSTLPRGSDGVLTSNIGLESDFNPRSLAGATLSVMSIIELGIISIHAPLRERPVVLYLLSVPSLFQSTLPCGSDLIGSTYFLRRFIFQSTLPHGSDQQPCKFDTLYSISIHAPSRERPARLLLLVIEIVISIHAPSRERCQTALWVLALVIGFQSTLPCGSDRKLYYPGPYLAEFQSTLPCGSDL